MVRAISWIGFILGIILINISVAKCGEEIDRVGIWKDCNPEINNCEIGLECVHYYDNVYRCIKYLQEGEECGRSIAARCDKDLECVATDKTRQVCGTFSKDGAKECFVEPLTVCKLIQKDTESLKNVSPAPK